MKPPKEKALALVQSFGLLGMGWKETSGNTLELSSAKECAQICVDEMIKDRQYLYYLESGKNESAGIVASDLLELKKEIESL